MRKQSNKANIATKFNSRALMKGLNSGLDIASKYLILIHKKKCIFLDKELL